MASFNFTTRVINWGIIQLPNGQQKHVETSRTINNWIIAIYPDNNSLISITKDRETRTYKVKEDSEFIYSVQKTQIKAINGAKGLFDYIDREVTRNAKNYEYNILPLVYLRFLQIIWNTTKPQ